MHRLNQVGRALFFKLIQLYCQEAIDVFQPTDNLRKWSVFVAVHVCFHAVCKLYTVQVHDPIKVFPLKYLRVAIHALKTDRAHFIGFFEDVCRNVLQALRT